MTPAVLDELRSILGEDGLLAAPGDCWPYGTDNSRLQALPGAVVLPGDHGQVVAIVEICNRHHLPLTARGRGTGTTGAAVPVEQGLVISFERMNRILEVDPANRLLVAEPGATNQAVQDAARAAGFFWPPDPTSAAFCTLGGNLAHNSAGPRAVKYGTTRENTLGLRIVTGAGESLRTGTRTTKGVVGYDLTRLVIGSEGTLALVTEATLKLTPLPETIRTMQVLYRDIRAAAHAVARIMTGPVTPCALEFMDGRALDLIRAQGTVDLREDAGALLMIEVDGLSAGIGAAVETVAERARVDGCLDVQAASSEGEADALWAMRKSLSPALRNIAPKKINEDVVVPVSRIPELIRELDGLSRAHDITIVCFGHAGNGNIHVNLLIDPDDPRQSRAADACLDKVFDLTLKLGGTLSGEHGVGLSKLPYIARELDPAALDLMRRIRREFDPNGILNPGKGP